MVTFFLLTVSRRFESPCPKAVGYFLVCRTSEKVKKIERNNKWVYISPIYSQEHTLERLDSNDQIKMRLVQTLIVSDVHVKRLHSLCVT